MSLHLEFEPHSWYYEFAIKKDDQWNDPVNGAMRLTKKVCIVHDQEAMPYEDSCEGYAPKWSAFTDDGNTYSIVELQATTLSDIKLKVRNYWLRDGGKHVPAFYAKRLGVTS